MRDLADWTDKKFRSNGHVAHYVPFGEQRSLCGVIDGGGTETLLGTGNFDEIDEANALPECVLCLNEAKPKTPSHGSWDDLLPELIP